MKKDESRIGKIGAKINNASPLLLTQYSSEAAQLIKSFTKNTPFIIVMLLLITALTSFDLLMDLGFIKILSDEAFDTMIITVSIFLIVFTILVVRPVFRSQRILENWSNLFDKNAIRTSMIFSINAKSKEEILVALSETIKQIATPLQHYLSKSDHSEFYDITIDGATFDILIDESTVKSTIDENSLINTIQDYGGILIKITTGIVDKCTTQTFIESLQKYRKKGKKIGLAMIFGESITQDSYELVNKISDKNISANLILIEKPDSPDPDLMNLNNILT